MPKLKYIPLTPRETEVIRLLADGLLYKGIASEMGISVDTVKKHIRTAMYRTVTTNRTHLVAFAFRQGLIK